VEGLRLLSLGVPAPEALRRLLEDDDGRDQRQVAIIDREGQTAVHTGPACLDWAGHRVGPSYAAQGNMLVSAATLAALADTFESRASEPLAERMIAALAAAQDAGGDRRGQQAAALLVVKPGAGYLGADVLADLRVDDHSQPVEELQRLYQLHQLYFGATPDEEWMGVESGLATELRDHLDRLGYSGGDLEADLETWAGVENLEERVRGVERLDPVVLEHLRQQEGGPRDGR
jgi:uncharacterized Ntn-hydrolase superfamily protein